MRLTINYGPIINIKLLKLKWDILKNPEKKSLVTTLSITNNAMIVLCLSLQENTCLMNTAYSVFQSVYQNLQFVIVLTVAAQVKPFGTEEKCHITGLPQASGGLPSLRLQQKL